VRLKPHSQDGYRWHAADDRKHLFAKQLSKHSIGAYMELCREVGKSFEAVVLSNLNGEDQYVRFDVRLLAVALAH
jgi:hypothetical protein